MKTRYYVVEENENFKEEIKNHQGGGYLSVEEAYKDSPRWCPPGNYLIINEEEFVYKRFKIKDLMEG